MKKEVLIKKEKEMEGGSAMTIEKAKSISSEEFKKLSDECNGFNDEKYKNHQIHADGETIGDFILKGSILIQNNPKIKGKLL